MRPGGFDHHHVHAIPHDAEVDWSSFLINACSTRSTLGSSVHVVPRPFSVCLWWWPTSTWCSLKDQEAFAGSGVGRFFLHLRTSKS